MPVSTRLIKGRIKSIKSTRKITKAMELVAAAKMRKAVSNTLNTRPFSKYSWDVLTRIVGRGTQGMHPLLDARDVKRILAVVITPNRGLVGGLTANLLNYILTQLKEPRKLMISRVGDRWKEPSTDIAAVDVATVGKKGERALQREGYAIIASFGTISDTPTLIEARPLAKFVMDSFLQGRYDKVVVCYSDFISAVQQKPRVRQLLPVSSVDLEKMIAHVSGRAEKPLFEGTEQKVIDHTNGIEYKFEPSEKEVLAAILPKLVTTQVYQALLEASASEHSARMVAMKNASDAAGDIIEDLQLTFNQVRQAGITREIAEISSGKAALE